MSTVEERKKERIKKAFDRVLENNPITGISARIAKLLKGKLTPEKEMTLESIISDLKLSTGDRGAAEAIPKKDFEKSVARTKMIRKIQKNIKPAPMPEIQDDPRDNYPQFKNTLPQMEKHKNTLPQVAPLKKGGKAKSKYSKGGGVRATKYKI